MRQAVPSAVLSAMLLATAAAAQTPAPKTQAVTAYHEGEAVRLEMADPPRARPAMQFGPWRLGERSGLGEIKDTHPNLYIVVPGTQYTSKAQPEYDHNLVINTLPTSDREVPWDVIWVIVIDPALQADFRDERPLLLAAQETFRPHDLFDLSDVPGRALLHDYLGVETYRDLAAFEREGRLPRVLLVPAGYSLKAAAPAPDVPATRGETQP